MKSIKTRVLLLESRSSSPSRHPSTASGHQSTDPTHFLTTTSHLYSSLQFSILYTSPNQQTVKMQFSQLSAIFLIFAASKLASAAPQVTPVDLVVRSNAGLSASLKPRDCGHCSELQWLNEYQPCAVSCGFSGGLECAGCDNCVEGCIKQAGKSITRLLKYQISH